MLNWDGPFAPLRLRPVAVDSMSGVSLELNGKVALITGGSRGIGAETVRLFSQAGAHVAFNYQQAKDRAEALALECGGAGVCEAFQQELSTPEQGRALVASAIAAFGRLDILVVNHGIWPPNDAPIAEMSESQWRRTMGINLDSVFGLVQAAVTQMQLQGRPDAATPAGHIVLISSTAGQRGEANHADYAVTKGALISLTKSLSSELAPKGILVNCVAPGWVATEMSAAALDHPEIGREDRRRHPSRQSWLRKRDCGAGVVFVHAAGRVYEWRDRERQRRRLYL